MKTKIIVALLLLAPINAYAGFSVDTGGTLTNGLSSYYKLESNSNDSVGTRHMNEVNVSHVAGKIGNAAEYYTSFPVDSYSSSTASLGFTDTSSFTVAYWVYPRSPGLFSTQTHIAQPSNDTSPFNFKTYQYEISQDTYINVEIYGNNSGVYQTQGPFPLDSWYFVVATYDGVTNNVGLSVNNGSFANATYIGGSALSRDGIGIAYNAMNRSPDAIIDEVGIWNRVLTAQEITDLYNSGNGAAFTPRRMLGVGIIR